MAHEIMIPDAAQLPAHIINHELARQANEEAAANISAGANPRIKMSGKTFTLVDASGEETAIKQKELTEGPDENMYLKTVILRARKALQKVFYVDEYDPNVEGAAPDCFSNDGERPDPSIKTPQCDVCANCPKNAYGSARKGEGKACADNKILAVVVPNKGVHKLKITPASLRNWRTYVDKLTAAGIPVGNVFTLVGFVPEETYPVLMFQYGGPVPESAVEKLAELAQQPEVEQIVTERIQASSKATPAAKPSAEPVQEAPAQQEQSAADELGLGNIDGGPSEAPKEEAPAQEAAVADELTDEQLKAELGL